MTTLSLQRLLDAAQSAVALVPVGSTEPHGPHLPLSTDTVISAAACARAAELLEPRRVVAVVAPAVPFGVTQCATGFAGAVSVRPDALIAFLDALIEGFLGSGFRYVCLVNNHLEPEHDASVRDATKRFGKQACVASPLARRWARTLSEEFRKGECHAGCYETSIVMAADASLVDEEQRARLPEVPISLSDRLREGVKDFRAMGLENAYAGAPAAASAEHGREQIERLAEMVVGTVCEALGV